MAVAIVVNKGAACVPANLWSSLKEMRLFGNIFECAITVVTIQGIFTVVSDKQIFLPIIVIVAYATGLAPTGSMFKSGAAGDICDRAIAIVLEQVAMGLVR